MIVDDHDGFRTAARRLLEIEGFDVVAEGANGREALEAAGRLRPHIVVLDIGLPDLDGIEVARRLTATDEAPVVVLTSSRDAADYHQFVASCGARGFIPKGELSGTEIARLAAEPLDERLAA